MCILVRYHLLSFIAGLRGHEHVAQDWLRCVGTVLGMARDLLAFVVLPAEVTTSVLASRVTDSSRLRVGLVTVYTRCLLG